jgi:hypothetical protein
MSTSNPNARKAMFAKANAGRYQPRSSGAGAVGVLAPGGTGLQPAPLQPAVGKPPAELGARQIENRYIPK